MITLTYTECLTTLAIAACIVFLSVWLYRHKRVVVKEIKGDED